MDIINKNAIHRELLIKHGSNLTYLNVKKLLEGRGKITPQERSQLISILEEGVETAKKTLLKNKLKKP